MVLVTCTLCPHIAWGRAIIFGSDAKTEECHLLSIQSTSRLDETGLRIDFEVT